MCNCPSVYPSVTMCDFESPCLWTPSNHSQHWDWKVTSPSQVKSEQAGTVPASDHSVRSSDGKRGKTRILPQSSRDSEKSSCLSFRIVWIFTQRISLNIWILVFCLLVATYVNFKTFPRLASCSDFMTRLSQLCHSLCFHSVLFPPGHFLLLSVSPAAEDSGMCEHHLTSPFLPGSNEYCIFQVALFEAGPAVGNLTLTIQPALSTSPTRSVVLNRRNHGDRRSANRPFQFVKNSYLFSRNWISVKKQNRVSLLIEVLADWRFSSLSTRAWIAVVEDGRSSRTQEQNGKTFMFAP